MGRRAVTLTERLIECEAEFVKAATTKLFFLYIKHLPLMVFVLGLGLLLVYLRLLVFTAIPIINANIVPVVIGLDAVMIDFQLQSTILKIGWDIIAGVVDTFGGNLNTMSGPFSFFPKKLLKPKQVKAALNTFASTCVSYDSVDIIFAKVARTLIGPSLCPVLRYLYPIKPAFDAAMWMFGWASADPTPLGYAGENNCKDSPEDLSWVCAAIGVGYVILEVVFPLIVVLIALESLLWPSIRLAYVLAEETLLFARELVSLGERIETKASTLEKDAAQRYIAREEKRSLPNKFVKTVF